MATMPLPRIGRPRRIAVVVVSVALTGLTALAVLATLASPAFAAVTTCREGVWAGTVGTTPVTLSLTPNESGSPGSGSYYYRAALSDLVLLPDATPGDWKEIAAKGAMTGHLHLECDATTLQGRWQPPRGGKPLPITARRIADDRYNAAREAGLRPIVTTGAVGVGRFENLVLAVPDANGLVQDIEMGAGHQGVRLLGAAPGLAVINAKLHETLIDGLRQHIECINVGRIERSPDAAYETSGQQHVLAWSPEYIVIETISGGYCGGPHPYVGRQVTIYQADSGQPADVAGWIEAGSFDPADEAAVDSEEGDDGTPDGSTLRQMLDKAYDPDNGDPQCRTSLTWGGFFPQPKELVFQAEATSYAMRMCAEEIVLPLESVWRFLTPEGQRALASFR